ncbi:hypothetical protein PUNSTDRAFT_128823 [Punctularia strigosozonata HHB-11173 SS5]|uniref:uncharacterized protein n=1 Tax=Punctularia strigosozonata (strain HHB-11173) TaxID=741275 RepID=UPI0004416382|nr:uncharacterized protein PUNSTDRAFT_128823 [Punctularia strigosozonata HHB-11173 SS5]EIN13139.1 hypothetical protein PUNSTDRAFT_128823 [Punctularia strigosozonata HHB-11173 SS5]
MSTHSDIFADNAPPIDMDRLSFVTDTDATEDDILGPGRSLNCLLTSWGFRLDRLLITLARRMGYGPQERVSRALRQCATMRTLPIQSSSCRHQHAVSDELAGIPHHANLDKMLKWISDAPSLLCTMCRDRTVKVLVARSSVRRACQELVHLLNGPNVSSRVISVHYIMALVSFHVAFLDLFASLNAVTSLLRLRTILYLEQECESASLVSSSRRALACLTQSRVLNQIKEFDSLDACITLSGKELHLTRDDTIFTEYMGHLRRTSSHIIELTSDPDVQILAITRLRRFFVTWTSIWFKSSMVDELTFDVVQRWWRCLGECKDHTLQAALTDFLVSLYGPWFWTARPDTLEILLRPLLCFRAQHPDLCEGGGAVQAAAQTIQIGFRRNILWHPAPPMREELNSLKDRLEPGQLMGLMDASDPAASLLLIWEDHPLGGPCQMSFRERAMSSLDLERWINRGGIRREIPPGALEAICKNTVSLILSLSFSSTMMRDVEFIAPLWDKRVRLALASRLKAAAAETSTEVPEVLQEWLSRDVRDDLLELRCTGIVVGSLTDCGRKQPKARVFTLCPQP